MWGCLGTTTLQNLQILQDRTARVATNSCFDGPSKALTQEFGWLTIEQLIELETIKVIYRVPHNEVPFYMKEMFLKLSDTQSRELRISSTDLYIPGLRNSMGQKSFGYRGVRLLNKLIDEAKGARTYLAFKRILCKIIKQ